MLMQHFSKMKAFLLTLYPFIVASFVAGTPGGTRSHQLDKPKTLKEQLDWLHEFSKLWEGKQKIYLTVALAHLPIKEAKELFSSIDEDLDGFVKGAVEMRALLMKPNVPVDHEIPEKYMSDLLLHLVSLFESSFKVHDDLVHLLHDLEGHLHEGLKASDVVVAALFERYGFPVEHLADVPVQEVHQMLSAFLAGGSPLDKVVRKRAAGFTLRIPDTVGYQLLWLHQFALAVAKNAAFEAALLEQLNDVPNGKEVVEAIKELAADDGVLHKVVVEKCCGDAFSSDRRVMASGFTEAYLYIYITIIKPLLMNIRHEILKVAANFKAFCPSQQEKDFPVGLLESGEFTMDQVKCEPGKFVAVDGPLARIEALMKENVNNLSMI